MFQSGEVDHIVATDAIGMGLNLLVGHVAFASLRKFDGRSVRGLDPSEVAQIAGRAGRHLQDGTFGSVSPVDLDIDIARAVEEHRFSPITRLRYRSNDLDLSSLDALITSLRAQPHSSWLTLSHDATDLVALEHLALDTSIRTRARDPEALELLWEICRIPDFRGELFDGHTELLKEIFLRLSGSEPRLSDAWISSQVEAIDDVSGDVDTLVDRIAAIRTWTYVTHQSRWVQNPEAWQGETHAIEDRLSDALHDRLVHRFVQRSKGRRKQDRRPRSTTTSATPTSRSATTSRASTSALESVRVAAGHPFAALSKLRARIIPDGPEPEQAGADPWVERVLRATPGDVAFNDGRMFLDQSPVARLVAGKHILRPDLRLVDLEHVDAATRTKISRHLAEILDKTLLLPIATLRSLSSVSLSSHARGLVYQLEQGLGTVESSAALAQIEALTRDDQRALDRALVVRGERVIFLRTLLAPASIELRRLLLSTWIGTSDLPPSPRSGAVSAPVVPAANPALYRALGFVVVGPRVIRADMLERLIATMRAADLELDPHVVCSLIGCPQRDARSVLSVLSAGDAGASIVDLDGHNYPTRSAR
jgi:ATP-dependent RNA helicase SUPV3L1/SUV3